MSKNLHANRAQPLTAAELQTIINAAHHQRSINMAQTYQAAKAGLTRIIHAITHPTATTA